ncbi:MAG: Carbonic anhydrase or acetyltransferase, isoleucine patch superfamily [Chloroflexi bacterium]|jgi:carbonic anhydrase/acetyltransferase-like protein (isoleucine patch superfamily)|nr:MAG: Carbonic anhydrase or acetyltransferase, isoleucine patch superfamily [Chloroflexota bacterium]
MSTPSNIVPFGEVWPRIAEGAYIDPAARIVGDVEIESGVGIWPGAVLRGDDGPVVVREGAMVLENCVLEAPGDEPVIIGRDSIVSHAAVVHGATVGERAIVGIGAIVLDKAHIGDDSIIGAGAVVPPGSEIPDGKLVLGVPGKVIRDITDQEREGAGKELAVLRSKATVYKAHHDKAMD